MSVLHTNFIKLARSIGHKGTTPNISGSEIILKSPDFFLGDVTIQLVEVVVVIHTEFQHHTSGNFINILTPNFLFGSPTSNISGSSNI